MKNYLKFIAFMIVLWFCASDAKPQSLENQFYSLLNKPCPDFKFTKIVNSKKRDISLNELKGKAIILDFWSTSCIPCIEAMPHLDSLQKQFSERIQILPVAVQMDNRVEQLFRRLVELRKVSLNGLLSAQDTALYKQFMISGNWLGQYIWINENGLVKYYSSGKEHLTATNIHSFLDSGKVSSLEKDMQRNFENMDIKMRFDLDRPLFMNGNGGEADSMIYRSLLSHVNKLMAGGNLSYVRNGSMFQQVMASVSKLYQLAYSDTITTYPVFYQNNQYGKFWPEPILEVKDTSLFKIDPSFKSFENLYNYSLVVPKSKGSAMYLQKLMRSDLMNYFGYSATVETRMMPCLKLVCINKNQPVTKFSNTHGYESDDNPYFLELRNLPVKNLIYSLWRENQLQPPIIDSTGIDGNIDIKINADLTNIDELRVGLRKNGLDLIKSVTEMKVVVIHDADL